MTSVEFFTPYLEHFTYFGILTALVASGLGLPVSEDLIIVICGFLIYHGIIHFLWTFPICYLGIVSGDLILYIYGRRYGQNILQNRWIKGFISKEKVNTVENYFDRYGSKTIFLARHVPVIRAIAFLLAGAMKIKLASFLLIDGLSAILGVPLIIALGYWFADQIDQVEKGLVQIEYMVAIGLLVGVVSFLAWQRFSRH